MHEEEIENEEAEFYVEDLEEECGQALRGVVQEYFDGLPPRTVHLMAKAAVAVLEAVVDDSEGDDELESLEESSPEL